MDTAQKTLLPGGQYLVFLCGHEYKNVQVTLMHFNIFKPFSNLKGLEKNHKLTTNITLKNMTSTARNNYNNKNLGAAINQMVMSIESSCT